MSHRSPHHSVAQQSLPLYLATATALNGPDRRRPGHRHIRDFLLSTRRSLFRRFVAKRRVDRRVSAAEQWSTRVCTDRWMDTTLLLRIPRPNQRVTRMPALSVAERMTSSKLRRRKASVDVCVDSSLSLGLLRCQDTVCCPLG